jgi:hypothetical protein
VLIYASLHEDVSKMEVQLHAYLMLALGQFHALFFIPIERVSLHLLNRKMGGPQRLPGHVGDEDQNSCPGREFNPKSSP